MSKQENNWDRFLDPDVVRPSLFLATMFITTFEILKNSIVDRILDFYSIECSAKGAIASPEYDSNVLSRKKSPTYASLDWLYEQQAIDDNDLKIFEQLKKPEIFLLTNYLMLLLVKPSPITKINFLYSSNFCEK